MATVPKGAYIVRIKDGYGGMGTPEVGDIIKTTVESSDNRAYYKANNSIPEGSWRYATALEMYCFMNINIQVTNIYKITSQHEKYYQTYLKSKNHGNEIEVPSVETTRPNGIRPSAIRIRKPTKQVTVGIRPIGNATKGKRSKERIASFILKTEAVKF